MTSRREDLDRDDRPQRPPREPLVSLSIVVPLFNEEQNVAPLVAETRAVQQSLEIESELILIDDGSNDGTSKELQRLQESAPEIRVLRVPENRGQSTAIVAGVRAARMSHVATLDGDLQNDPSDLANMLPHLEHFDVVIGWRVGRKDTWSRRVGARLANYIRSRALNDGTSDTGCSLKVFPRERFRELPLFDGMHRFLPFLFLSIGATVQEVPVNHRARRSGISKYSNLRRLRRTIPDLIGAAWLARRQIRLRDIRESRTDASSGGSGDAPF